MAAFPQSKMEMVDGSPVVPLHAAAAHVEVFLRAIFDSSYFMPPPAKPEVRGTYPSDLLETLAPTTSIKVHMPAHHSEVIAVSTEVGALWVPNTGCAGPGLSPLLDENERRNLLSTEQLRKFLRSHAARIAAMLHFHQFLRTELPPCEEPQHCPARLHDGNDLLLRVDAVSRGY
ncbi:hypothetical protein C8R47DRAFT_594503 [Mycena vitilis]|nr:hypothetical protein C8R47DRAFT_594503 [Mycena vitilis]